MPYQEQKNSILSFLKEFSKVKGLNDQDFNITTPPTLEQGHLAIECFKAAKSAKIPPPQLAKELSDFLIQKQAAAKVMGPYVNIKLNLKEVSQSIFSQILSSKPSYGREMNQKKDVILLEYCSPNIAKRLMFHHIRTTLIGNSLSNIFKFFSFPVVRTNFIGDWGLQFAKILCAISKWGVKEKKGTLSFMKELEELYTRFSKEEKNSPSLKEEAQSFLQKLEKQDPVLMKQWNEIRVESIKAMNTTLSRLSVNFDYVEGESDLISKIEETLKDIKEKALAELSEGAWIVRLEQIEVPALIQKSDGTSLYLTRDIAAAIFRKKKFNFTKSIYVVSSQQALHFKQLFGVLKKMGHSWAEQCTHLPFGTVLLGSSKMSTREGNALFLDDILDEAKKRALVECTAKNPDLKNKEEIAEMIGISAIIFGELSTHRSRDIHFNWEEVLALEGETGPYVQYTHVRCTSLLSKFGETLSQVPHTDKISYEEEELILELSKFKSTLLKCIEELEPFYLTSYLIELAKSFNRFYYKKPILNESDKELRLFRVAIVFSTQYVLNQGLTLLGIKCPTEM